MSCPSPTTSALSLNQWLPMLNLIYVVLTPMAVIIAEGFGASSSLDGYNESKAAVRDNRLLHNS